MINIYKKGNFFCSVNSAKEASEKTGLHTSTIEDAVKDQRIRGGYSFVRPNLDVKRMRKYIVKFDDEEIECTGIGEVCKLTGYNAPYVRKLINHPNKKCKIIRI